MSERIDVFISSTKIDLLGYRDRLCDVIMSMGMHPIDMKDFNPDDRNAVQRCYDEVQQSEIFVGIYAHRYGYCPTPEIAYSAGRCDGQTSITHMEYQWAKAKGIPLLLFVIEEAYEWHGMRDTAEVDIQRLKAFKSQIGTDHVIGFFNAPDNLAVQVSTALHSVVQRLGLTLTPETWRVLESPEPPSHFVGRAQETAEIRALLQQERRVWVQGAGGMGKTSLAKHLGRALAPDYPGSVLWASFGPNATPTATESTLREIFREWKQVTPQGRNTELKDVTPALIKGWLAEAPAPILVIVDDVWHREPLDALYAAIPSSVHVLITGRERSLLIDEGLYELKHLSAQDALAMLTTRLQAAQQHEANLREIAGLLGNHALALHIAATYLKRNGIFSAPNLIERINLFRGGTNPFEELQVGRDRDTNLEIALSLSYEPLSEDEKQAFRLLGAIPAGLDFAAYTALAVYGTDISNVEARVKAEKQLEAVARAALVDRTPAGRYLLHQNLHSYAVALMKRRQHDTPPIDELTPAQQRYHAEVIRIAKQFEDLPPEQWDTTFGSDFPHIHRRGRDLVEQTRAWLAKENAPTLEALTEPQPTVYLTPEQIERGRELLEQGVEFADSGIIKYVHQRAVGIKGVEWHQLGLVAARGFEDRKNTTEFLSNIGLAYSHLGDQQQALAYYNQAIFLVRTTDDKRKEAAILNNIGLAHNQLGHQRQALTYYGQALTLIRTVGDERGQNGEAIALHNIGQAYSALGDQQQALDYYRQALPIMRLASDRGGESIALHNIGKTYLVLDDQQQALDYYRQALPITQFVGDKRQEGAVLNDLGLVHSNLGKMKEAMSYYQQALSIAQAIDDRNGQAAILNNIALIYDDLGETEKALHYYQQALLLVRSFGNKDGEAITLCNISGIYYQLGNLDEAINCAELACEIGIEIEHYARDQFCSALEQYRDQRDNGPRASGC